MTQEAKNVDPAELKRVVSPEPTPVQETVTETETTKVTETAPVSER